MTSTCAKEEINLSDVQYTDMQLSHNIKDWKMVLNVGSIFHIPFPFLSFYSEAIKAKVLHWQLHTGG